MKRLCLLILLSAGFLTSKGQTRAEDIQSFSLKNGMKILVLEDHSIPNANMYLFWKVGSRNEVPGITGLAHFFEHMMFNGSKQFGPKEFDRVMEASGGSNNAYTSEDVTVYTDWFPSSSMEVIFKLEADRIASLAIDPKMVESERGVVLSERRTGLENSNYRTLSAQVKSTAFFAHPYRWPVIGYESDIKSWTQKDLEDFFHTYYAPNNCVVVIVGDVKLDQVKALSEKYFAPIPPNKPPKAIRTVEPPQEGERRVKAYKAISSPNVLMAWHVPNGMHADYYALDLLNAILTRGRSSRLQKKLVFEQQLAINVFSFVPSSFDPDLMQLYAVCSRGVETEKLEAAIYESIQEIQEKGVTKRELQKVKNQAVMDFYRTLETINGKANTLGSYELFFGDYKKMFTAPDEYAKVSLEDIQRVAKTYLTERNRTVGVLLPEN